jgi:hypothetical protein
MSPMTVLFAVGLVPLFHWTGRGLPPQERRWVYILLATAIAVRVALILGLFLASDRDQTIFSTFFGDERYLELRALWIRNQAVGVPISKEAFLYSGNDVGWTSYITVLAFLQVLVGPAPYGARLFALFLYLTTAVTLFRVMRARIGPSAAFAGLTLVLWIPTLLLWSISLLKEPLYLAFVAAAILLVAGACRPGRVLYRLAAIMAAALCLAALETVRPGGAMLVAAGIGVGLVLRLLAWNGRVAAVSAVVVPLVLSAALTRPAISDPLMRQIKWAANWHRGHVFTPGHGFKTMDEQYYVERFYDERLTTFDGAAAARFVIRSAVAFATMPLPWQVETATERIIVPEQMLLYCLLLLMVVGIPIAAHRDPLLTSILCGYAIVSAGVIAITSGNVGTLVRHRALVVPFVVWFAAVGAERVVSWLADRASKDSARFSPRVTEA